MYGRYGVDSMGKFLIALAFITIILANIFESGLFSMLSWVLLIYAYFRMFSKNVYKRASENQKFLSKTSGIRTWLYKEKNMMAQRKTNKRTVDLLKSNAVSFRNKISRWLILSSRDERKQFCNEIIRNGILRAKIQHVQYANSLSRFNDIRWCYNPKLSDEDAFDYACFVVSLFHEKVENFNILRNEYEIAYLSGKYERALEILDNIDGVICVSLWSLGQRFLIKELRDGLEENKKLLSKIADEVNDDIILCILYYYSSMAESGLSFDNYQTEAMKFIKTLGDSVLGKYICNKLSLESVYQHSDISLTIQLDSQISLIDLFITLEKCLPVHYKNQICDGSALNLPYGVENINMKMKCLLE